MECVLMAVFKASAGTMVFSSVVAISMLKTKHALTDTDAFRVPFFVSPAS
jgi:hypothetical protein